MSTTSSGTPPVSGSRGRHGHTRSNHRASRHPAVSSVDLQKLRDDPQINLDASVPSNGYAQVNSHVRQHSYTPSHIPSLDHSSEEQETTSTTALQEIRTAICIAAPYVLASTLLIPTPLTTERKLEPIEEFQDQLDSAQPALFISNRTHGSICLIKASVLASLTLLLVGLWEKFERVNAPSGSRGNSTPRRKTPGANGGLLRVSFVNAIAIWLPLFASLTLGGERVVLTMLVAFSSGLPALLDPRNQPLSPKGWSKPLNQWRATLLCFVAMIVFDIVNVGSFLDNGSFLAGYLALLLSVFVARPPFWGLQPSISGSTSAVNGVELMRKRDEPGLVGSYDESAGTLISGVAFSLFTLLLAALFGEISINIVGSIVSIVVAFLCALSLVASSPRALFSKKKIGLVSGSAVSVLFTSSALQRWSWQLAAELSLGALGYLAAYSDGNRLYRNDHSQRHLHHTDESRKASWVTLYLLRSSEQYPLLHSILREKDSRRIFYFMSLNFLFMLVQLSYGFATGSLGLLSDSIHMFFDCLALVVGLCAAVMSKWPPSARFPYGYGKVDTLAGFANGIFLMIISIEIVYEAVERLLTGSQMHRIGELLVVSTAGLCVNLVGIMAFDHAHHGHGHGHGHSHGHDHDSEHSHSHSHSHHANENMHGIFLHILADTLGSVAVVISTILVHFYGWPGFDPIASCIIAILIFASAIPLVSSTAKMLLLSLPADVEYSLRDTLAGVSSLRGVVGYTVPKFWLDDIAATTPDTHDHSGHSHHDRHHHHDHHSHHDHHDASEKKSSCGQQKILGVIHVIASNGADLEDVRQRTVKFLQDKNMDITVQVEKEGDARCWCGSGNRTS